MRAGRSTKSSGPSLDRHLGLIEPAGLSDVADGIGAIRLGRVRVIAGGPATGHLRFVAIEG
jgi:hypothetical protein